jgi:hypothetical protein
MQDVFIVWCKLLADIREARRGAPEFLLMFGGYENNMISDIVI